MRPPRAEWAILKWLAVALLGAMYLNGAHNMGGTEGLMLFLSYTVATYLGFFLRFMSSGAAIAQDFALAVQAMVDAQSRCRLDPIARLAQEIDTPDL